MTIFEAYNDIKSKLKSAGIDDSVFEAKQIIKFVTGYTNTEILNNYTEQLTGYQTDKKDEILKRRLERYPLQYILGFWDFYGRRFSVGTGVLIPRQDTETVIETCLEKISGIKAPQILDLCAGTGCIGITLAAENSEAAVTMVEKYGEAAKYLAENIKRNAPDNAKTIIGDIFENCGAQGEYDLIVSNPPYIKSADMQKLQPEVAFEPSTALDGGEDGLKFYRHIAREYKNSLKKGGCLVFEIGYDEGEAVKDILKNSGYSDIDIKKDYYGNERVVFGTLN